MTPKQPIKHVFFLFYFRIDSSLDSKNKNILRQEGTRRGFELSKRRDGGEWKLFRAFFFDFFLKGLELIDFVSSLFILVSYICKNKLQILGETPISYYFIFSRIMDRGIT